MVKSQIIFSLKIHLEDEFLQINLTQWNLEWQMLEKKDRNNEINC